MRKRASNLAMIQRSLGEELRSLITVRRLAVLEVGSAYARVLINHFDPARLRCDCRAKLE